MKIVQCTEHYWEFVRELRLDERVIDGFIETTSISEEQQINYMNLNSHYFYIVLINDIPAGYVGVIENDIRVCTHPDFQGMGTGKFMISHIVNVFPNAIAKVKHENIASKNLFISCGFKELYKDFSFIYYKKNL